MTIEQIITLLRVAGLVAILPAVLSIVALILICVKSPIREMQKFVRENKPEPVIRVPTQKTKKEKPPEPMVHEILPEETLAQIQAVWEKAPKPDMSKWLGK